MTPAWHQMTPERRALAGRLFEALTALDEISAEGPKPAKQVGFSQLYAFATDPDQPLSETLSDALQHQPRLAADLQRLLDKGCRHRGPRLAAASTGAINHREGQGFALDIRPSRADASQVYVVIQLAGELPLPSMLFVTRPEAEFHKQALPSPAGDRLQLLFDADAEIVRALQDPKSEVLLK